MLLMRKCGINIVERGTPQMTIWRMRIACWIPKATNTHTQCNARCFSTARMVARMRQKLRYTYILFLVMSYIHVFSSQLNPTSKLNFSRSWALMSSVMWSREDVGSTFPRNLFACLFLTSHYTMILNLNRRCFSRMENHVWLLYRMILWASGTWSHSVCQVNTNVTENKLLPCLQHIRHIPNANSTL